MSENKNKLIRVNDALNIILNTISSAMPAEEVDLNNSRDRILHEDIISDINIPIFDNSAMDGFALRSDDIKNAATGNPIILKVIDDIPAGYIPNKAVKQGEASLIMTGAPIPPGADCVVIVEHTSPCDTPEYVKIFFPGKRGDNIRISGEDIKKGEKILESGIIIKSSDIGLLAALGKNKVKVSKKPSVAIIASGDELVEINSALTPGKIRCSNTYMLASLVEKYGGISNNLGISKDTEKDLMSYLNRSLKSDIIITIGGVSVGKYDVVRDALKKLGGEFKLWQVAMKPGKPLAFCLWNGKPVFGLPGNPISSFICFEQFVRPAIWKMTGKKGLALPTIIATVQNNISKKQGIRYFARSRIYIKDGEVKAAVQGPHGSNMLKPLTRSNGFVVLKEDSSGVSAGEKAEVELYDFFSSDENKEMI
ncbi:molybdopterin molybdotransferase MoeA [Candidatus Poribacteria bacterium]|nr:molybdopterin molybdotransferase MoeA [Candidatus Poribacteria bacterium]